MKREANALGGLKESARTGDVPLGVPREDFPSYHTSMPAKAGRPVLLLSIAQSSCMETLLPGDDPAR